MWHEFVQMLRQTHGVQHVSFTARMEGLHNSISSQLLQRGQVFLHQSYKHTCASCYEQTLVIVGPRQSWDETLKRRIAMICTTGPFPVPPAHYKTKLS